jgi:hypothetical protein
MCPWASAAEPGSGATASGLVSGEVDYQIEPLEQPGPSRLLMGISQPRTDVALDL